MVQQRLHLCRQGGPLGDLNIENSQSNSARARRATFASIPALLDSLGLHWAVLTSQIEGTTGAHANSLASRTDLGHEGGWCHSNRCSPISGHGILMDAMTTTADPRYPDFSRPAKFILPIESRRRQHVPSILFLFDTSIGWTRATGTVRFLSCPGHMPTMVGNRWEASMWPAKAITTFGGSTDFRSLT
jgi:hypothetical protein